MRARPEAVLWDFDGTLVNTEPIWAQTEAEMLADHDVVWGEDMMRSLIGQSAAITTRQMAEAIGRPDRHEEIHDELHRRIADRLRRDGLPFLPGALELLEEAADDGVPAAVVTASNGTIMAAAVNLLPPAVQFVVHGDDVARSKPHPDPYLLAMERLGVSSDGSIALEDSVPGTASALAAGAFVYAVPVLAQLESHPRMVISSDGLASTTWPDLLGIWHEAKGNRR